MKLRVGALWRRICSEHSAEHQIATLTPAPQNFVIVIDGESHPIQLDKPLVLTLGERRRTVVVRSAP